MNAASIGGDLLLIALGGLLVYVAPMHLLRSTDEDVEVQEKDIPQEEDSIEDLLSEEYWRGVEAERERLLTEMCGQSIVLRVVAERALIPPDTSNHLTVSQKKLSDRVPKKLAKMIMWVWG